MRAAARALSVADPPIITFRERHRDLLGDPELIDLSQAVPSYAPPPPALEAILAAAADPRQHFYTVDQGLPECREAVCRWLKRFGARLAPEELIITPGANAAFHFAINILTDPGDPVALLAPLYFNQPMSVQLLGGEVVEIPWEDSIDWDRVDRSGARVVVLVTPSNPTGRALARAELRTALEWAQARGATMVVDETYLEFQESGRESGTMLAFDDWREGAVVLGSFSKSLALTGHRVGYVFAPPSILSQILKVQDAAVICAPRLGQLAATSALDWSGFEAWISERRREIEARVRAFREAPAGLFQIEEAGAFFVWLRHPEPDFALLRSRLRLSGVDDRSLADESLLADLLAREARILTLPGSMAGSLGRSRLRVAVGNAAQPRLREEAERMRRFRWTEAP